MPLIKQTKKTGIKYQEHKSETQTERKWLRKNQQSSTEVQSYRQNNQPRGWHGWHHLVHKPGSVDTKHQSPWAGDRAERGDPKWTRVSSLMNKELACQHCLYPRAEGQAKQNTRQPSSFAPPLLVSRREQPPCYIHCSASFNQSGASGRPA